MIITIAICTWNRADLLDKTLDALGGVVVPAGVQWEVLVVNNNCTDHTDQVIAAHAGKLPLRRIFEPKQGLSNARNRVLAEASGGLLLWTDDDVLVTPDWLAEYVAAANRFPDAAFFGGPVEPWYESAPPKWVERNERLLSYPLTLLRKDNLVRRFNPKEKPIGANMAFRLEILKRFPFNPVLGRTGDQLLGWEEVDVLDRMMRANLYGVWVGMASVRHWVPRSRMTWKYVWDWHVGAGVSEIRREGLPGGVYWWGMPRWTIRRWITGCLKWAAGCLLRNDRRRVEGWLAWASASGTIAECRKSPKAVGAKNRTVIEAMETRVA